VDVRGLRWSATVGEEARTLEEVATRYLGFLRASGVAPPWRLLGYSIGGTLAWEMARQARAHGEEVAFLGIVDTPNYARDAAVFERLALTVAKNVLSFMRGFSVAFQVGYVGRLRFRGLLRALRRMRALGLGYRPGPLDRTLVLLRSRHPRAGFGDDLGWKAIASSLSIHFVDGDHQSMMNERNAPTIARIVGERLAGAKER
jgi:thioesterase domain-containing protein